MRSLNPRRRPENSPPQPDPRKRHFCGGLVGALGFRSKVGRRLRLAVVVLAVSSVGLLVSANWYLDQLLPFRIATTDNSVVFGGVVDWADRLLEIGTCYAPFALLGIAVLYDARRAREA